MGAIFGPESLACFPYPPSAGASVTGIPGPGFPGGFHGEISGGIPRPGFRGEFPGEKQRPKLMVLMVLKKQSTLLWPPFLPSAPRIIRAQLTLRVFTVGLPVPITLTTVLPG